MRRPRLPRVAAGRAFRREPLSFLLGLDGDGDVVRFRAGTSDFTLLRSPEAIHRVLVAQDGSFGEGKWTLRGASVMHDCLITREGAAHRERRVLLQPSFHRRRLARCGEAIVGRALRLDARRRNGSTVDVRREMATLALAVVGDALFSSDLEPEAAELVPALETLLRAIPRRRRPWPLDGGTGAARARLDATADRLVAERRNDANGHDDLLDVLLGAGLGDDAVRDEVVSLLIAGVDTTPGALAWTWLLLARHPDAEERLLGELRAVLGERTPTVDDLEALPYLDRVVREVLRLYPPVHFVDRRPLVDVDLDGHVLEAGSYLLLSPLLTHRDERFFDEPSAFDPDRWRDGRGQRPRYAYFPFGGGPHTCVGESLARMELALVVATLAPRWRARPVPGFPADPSPQTTRLPMILERR